jgi:uncharacterized protein YndB with AHSA1/START domain
VIQFQNAVTIRRPAEEVFAFLADVEKIPRWNYAIVETRKTSPGPVGIGSTYVQVRSVPRHLEETLEVTGYEPPRYIALRGTLGPFDADLSYEIKSGGEKTEVVNRVALQPRGILGVLGQAASGRVRDAVAENLRRLKQILEE